MRGGEFTTPRAPALYLSAPIWSTAHANGPEGVERPSACGTPPASARRCPPPWPGAPWLVLVPPVRVAAVTATLSVPTGSHARLLYGLARCRPLPQPSRSIDGWDCYLVDGLDGGAFQIALRGTAHPDRSDEDDLALAGLHRGASDVGGLVELVVVLSRLLELGGVAGLWCWQRLTEVMHGRGARPERHNDPAKQWLALFSRGRMSYDPDTSTSPEAWAQPVVLERHHRSSCTAHLDPTLQRELAAVTYEAPVETFVFSPPTRLVDKKRPQLGERKITNPEGNLPSRRTRARARVALLLEIAPRRRSERPRSQLDKEIQQLVVDAGGDMEPVNRRRHVRAWTLGLMEEITKAAELLRAGVVSFKKQVGSVVRDVLRLERPPVVEGATQPQDAPPAPSASRAPP